MRQRVDDRDGARLQAALLIADEPTTALDVTIQAQILELIERLKREHGIGGASSITHDLGVVAEIADRVLVMYAGRMRRGRAARRDVFCDPQHPYTCGLLASIPRARPAEAERGCRRSRARRRR